MGSKEWILNIAINRWGLNKKSVVGPVSQWIREVQPKNEAEWKAAYLKRLEEFLKSKNIDCSPEAYLSEVGRKLYVKISEIMSKELEEVSLEDCVDYVWKLVVDRTFQGFEREKTTIHQLLEEALGDLCVNLIPAPDEMDRKYNVDFYIPICEEPHRKCYIGIQIKPVTFKSFVQNYNWEAWISDSHKKFEKEYGGRVFVVFSAEENRRKKILNEEIIEEIRREVQKLITQARTTR